MRAFRPFRLLLAVVAIAALAWLLRPEAGMRQADVHAGPVPPAAAAHAATLPAFLPAEAGPVIRRIQRGESFPNRQDGSVFGNREQRLPARERGYYREFTVPTPGLSHRGARRIVTGGDPPREWYYTGDHYDSFRRFEPPAAESTP
ncbi:MAG: ribonuclease [Pseudoxanthomonas sp.]|nr:ribonuclease [Pseudoxanthomonas sp.]